MPENQFVNVAYMIVFKAGSDSLQYVILQLLNHNKCN